MAKFCISYTVRGRATETVEADDEATARAAIEARVEADDFELDLDEIDDVDFTINEMHPVTRDGREVWTTYIRTGDVRGHQSALNTGALFAHYQNQEAAAAASEGGE
ncbi:hypothetical protein [Devosia elaeis]|uniref:Uncharacterized protein n=1 Tax=Devosia elaeis TaxID=1770058 RepID=A0A178I1X0_9HYPH|nr:hypothetical protein [Devosia elaeis]OAM78195.1 hypothetical protein A3840_06740 [Devosia elaeis]